MKLLHPNYKTPKKLSELEKYKDDGVYNLIPEDEQLKLNEFLISFDKYRDEKKEKITDANLYLNLPFSINDKSWKSKQKDIEIIDRICEKRKELKILDFCGWNGWLSNYLSGKGHNVITTDIFINKFDGLKAINYYKNSFTALQLLPNEIWRINETFDLIIFNRNWAYLENKEEIFTLAKSMLNSNGIILFTGLTFYKKSLIVEKQISNSSVNFESKYGIPLFYFKAKGYLDNDDLIYLKKEATLYPYNFFKNLLKRLFLSNKSHLYAIYRNDKITISY